MLFCQSWSLSFDFHQALPPPTLLHFSNCPQARCIALILAAAAGQPLALRLEGAVAVIVGIINAAAVLCVMAVATSSMRAALRKSWQAKKPLPRLYSALVSLAWLAALAWAGWLWSFGIRLLWLMVWQAVVAYKAPEETPS